MYEPKLITVILISHKVQGLHFVGFFNDALTALLPMLISRAQFRANAFLLPSAHFPRSVWFPVSTYTGWLG
jgi:hypothetical protein